LLWRDAKVPVEKRIADRIRGMSLDEKLEMLSGIQAATRPKDLPRGLAIAASWDVDLASADGRAWARRAIAEGKDQVLGPDLGGYGDDPWLISRVGIASVEAIQAEGVIASPKVLPAEADEKPLEDRSLDEIRLAPFRAVVEEAGSWSVIASGANPAVLTDLLRKDWGFKGFVVSNGADIGDVGEAMNAGIDAALAPGGVFSKASLKAAGDAGSLTREAVDEKVARILRARFSDGVYDRKPEAPDPHQSENLNRRAAAESVILLGNDGALLPLDPLTTRSIAVTGDDLCTAVRAGAPSNISVRCAARGEQGREDVRITSSQEAGLTTILIGGNRGSASLAAPTLNGLADVLFGRVVPSGKLPVTLSAYPLGHGLSYTTFEYSDLRIFPATPRYGQIVQVVMKVRNSGTRPGAEVIQVYIHRDTPDEERPLRELKSFRRVELKPGESTSVTLILDRRSMWFYDPRVRDWAAEPGVYQVLIGSSSRDIRLKGSFELFE
jgi:beta-glucosidase-like glycosyl hydrolase